MRVMESCAEKVCLGKRMVIEYVNIEWLLKSE
jgi:hypothetical protein